VAILSGLAREGWIQVTPGNEADYARMRDDLVAYVNTLTVQEIDFDRKSARLMMQDLRALLEPKLGREKVEHLVLDIPQNIETMDPAMKTTEGLVLGKRLVHDGNPAMAWMISNVVIERNLKGEIYPRKAGGKDSANKIDGPVALWTALSQARLAAERQPEYRMLILGGTRLAP
jgi:phage terminase large subunit-like protein